MNNLSKLKSKERMSGINVLNILNTKEKRSLGSTGLLDRSYHTIGTKNTSNKMNPTNSNKNTKASLDSLQDKKNVNSRDEVNLIYHDMLPYESYNNYSSFANLSGESNADSSVTLSGFSKTSVADNEEEYGNSTNSYLESKNSPSSVAKTNTMNTNKQNEINKKQENYQKFMKSINDHKTTNVLSDYDFIKNNNILYTDSNIASSSQTITSISDETNKLPSSKINPSSDQVIFDNYYNIYQSSKNNIVRNDSEESLSNYF